MGMIREWLARKGLAQSVVSRVVSSWQVGRPLTPPHDYLAFAEWYRRNVLAAACVWEIATSAAEPTLLAYRVSKDGKEEPLPSDHLLNQLLRKPNTDQSQFEFTEQVITDQQVAGQFYIVKERQRGPGSPVVGLKRLAPHRMRIVPAADGSVQSFVQTLDGRERPPIDPADIIHGPLHPDPVDDYYGLSPIAVLARYGDLDDVAVDYLRAFFSNNAEPAGILKFKAKVDPIDRERVKEIWKQDHGRESGWHSISVLDGDVDYKETGSSPEKLNLERIFGQTETRICMAFGVPPILVGAQAGLMRATYSNYASARRSLWDDTLSPLYRRNGDYLTNGLAPEFDDGAGTIVIRYDISRVSALQEQQDVKRTFALEAFAGKLMTVNEARVFAGLAPLPDTDPRGAMWIDDLAPAVPIAQAEHLPTLVDAGGAKHTRAIVRQILLEEMEHGAHDHELHNARPNPAAAAYRRVARHHFRQQAPAVIDAVLRAGE